MTQDITQKLLQQIAQELSAPEVIFPTSFDLTLRVQALLKDPDVSLDKVAEVMQAEPLMSSKILAHANSAAVRGGGPEITELRAAVMRVGLEAVRSVAYTVAMEQLVRSRHMAPFSQLSRQIWLHSLMTAALARRLAKTSRLNTEKAFFMGIVHDLGAFYLLYRGSALPELAADRDRLMAMMHDWHDGIGHALLAAMGLPEDILHAVHEHEARAEAPRDIHRWEELLWVADHLAQTVHDWVPAGLRAQPRPDLPETLLSSEERAELLAQAGQDIQGLKSAIG